MGREGSLMSVIGETTKNRLYGGLLLDNITILSGEAVDSALPARGLLWISFGAVVDSFVFAYANPHLATQIILGRII